MQRVYQFRWADSWQQKVNIGAGVPKDPQKLFVSCQEVVQPVTKSRPKVESVTPSLWSYGVAQGLELTQALQVPQLEVIKPQDIQEGLGHTIAFVVHKSLGG